MANVTITVNGVPVSAWVDAEAKAETLEFRDVEIRVMGKVVRGHAKSSGFRNHSGARSGKGRVIYSAAAVKDAAVAGGLVL